MARIRYHQRDGHIIVTWNDIRVGTITRNDDGTHDAETIKSKYHLPKVSRIDAMRYYRQFDWRSIVGDATYTPARVRFEPKQPKLTCQRWAYF